MNPYYQDKWVTIYHGDCREILPQLDIKVDLVLTDPPYGVSYRKKGDTYMVGDTVNIIPYFLPVARQVLKDTGAIYLFSSTTKLVDTLPIFCTYFKLHSIVIWDKRIGQIPRQLSHYKLRYEPILYGSKGLHRLTEYADDVYQCDIPRGKQRVHPTQKPFGIVNYLMAHSVSGNGEIVLDPFLGSGTAMVAAERLRVYGIGIEIEEKYCEIAARRCCQEVMELNV